MNLQTCLKKYRFLFSLCILGLSVLGLSVLSPSVLYAEQNSSDVKKCKLISKLPQSLQTTPGDKEQLFLQNIFENIKKARYSKIYDALHPNLKEKKTEVSFVTTLRNRLRKYGRKLDIANLRTWSIYTPKGDPQALFCDTDQVSIFPTYGYPEQYTIWLQVLGTMNLGRVYIQVVKDKKDKLHISNVTINQWTHFGKDPSAWAQEAQSNLEAKDYVAAWLKFKMSYNLLRANSYMQFPDSQYLQGIIEQIEKKHNPEEIVRKSAPDYELAKINTAMTLDGTSLLAYLVLKTPKNRWDREKQCQKVGTALKKAKRLENLAGVQCSFYYPQHNIKLPPQLGSVFWMKSKL